MARNITNSNRSVDSKKKDTHFFQELLLPIMGVDRFISASSSMSKWNWKVIYLENHMAHGSLKLTSPVKINAWKTTFLLGRAFFFSGYNSFW